MYVDTCGTHTEIFKKKKLKKVFSCVQRSQFLQLTTLVEWCLQCSIKTQVDVWRVVKKEMFMPSVLWSVVFYVFCFLFWFFFLNLFQRLLFDVLCFLLFVLCFAFFLLLYVMCDIWFVFLKQRDFCFDFFLYSHAMFDVWFDFFKTTWFLIWFCKNK